MSEDIHKFLFYTEQQENAIFYTVRAASGLSIAGCLFVFVTFLGSNRFRKPINRLLFYATIGNMFMAVASMISFAGIYAGRNSVLCQTQGFLVQWFFPADAVWNLAMAINVYLTVFKHFDARRLRRLEWLYNLVSYGLTFIVALVYCFIQNEKQGRMYGPAVLYCWVSAEWDVFRIALCYGPAWFAILASLLIYLAAGSNIYRKRHQLRLFRGRTALKRTTSVRSHLGRRPLSRRSTTPNHHTIAKVTEMQTSYQMRDGSQEGNALDRGQTAARIEAYPRAMSCEPVHPSVSAVPSSNKSFTIHHANSTIKANAAAWGYTKVAMLFFVCLMITWVPSSIFRLYSVLDPSKHSFVLAYIAGLVIPLQGFWNFILYVVTSWDAVQGWFVEDLFHKTRNRDSRHPLPENDQGTSHVMTTQNSIESMRTAAGAGNPNPNPNFGASMASNTPRVPMHLPPPVNSSVIDNDKWVALPYWGQSREASPREVLPHGLSVDTHLPTTLSADAYSPETLVAGERSSGEVLSPEEARVYLTTSRGEMG